MGRVLKDNRYIQAGYEETCHRAYIHKQRPIPSKSWSGFADRITVRSVDFSCVPVITL